MLGTPGSLTLRLVSALAGSLLAASAAMSEVNAQPAPADPDWPCVQRLLPEIAGGMIWPGPPLDQVEIPKGDRALKALAEELAARRVPLEEAAAKIETFAERLQGEEKPARLAALFKSTLEIINRDRASIINGVKRFSRGQRTLAEKIKASNREIEAMNGGDVLARDAAIAERDWDIRIFEDRRQSLTYLCEQPVLLEQRAFALARSIAAHLE
jgi:hypothetical protein